MKTTNFRTLTVSATFLFAIGCGSSDAPVRPVVKQEIAPEQAPKRLDPIERKGKIKLATN